MPTPFSSPSGPEQQRKNPRNEAVEKVRSKLDALRQAVEKNRPEAGKKFKDEAERKEFEKTFAEQMSTFVGDLTIHIDAARKLHGAGVSKERREAWQKIERAILGSQALESVELQGLLKSLVDVQEQTQKVTGDLAQLAAQVSEQTFADEQEAVDSYMLQFDATMEQRFENGIQRFFRGEGRDGKADPNGLGPRLAQMFEKVGVSLEDVTKFLMGLLASVFEKLPFSVRWVENRRWREQMQATIESSDARVTADHRKLLEAARKGQRSKEVSAWESSWRKSYVQWIAARRKVQPPATPPPMPELIDIVVSSTVAAEQGKKAAVPPAPPDANKDNVDSAKKQAQDREKKLKEAEQAAKKLGAPRLTQGTRAINATGTGNFLYEAPADRDPIRLNVRPDRITFQRGALEMSFQIEGASILQIEVPVLPAGGGADAPNVQHAGITLRLSGGQSVRLGDVVSGMDGMAVSGVVTRQGVHFRRVS